MAGGMKEFYCKNVEWIARNFLSPLFFLIFLATVNSCLCRFSSCTVRFSSPNLLPPPPLLPKLPSRSTADGVNLLLLF